MRRASVNLAFFGSSLLSSYWNGAATYYRGLIRALARHGHHVSFYEPDAYGRQAHRDIAMPDWARVVVYPGNDASALQRCVEEAAHADVVVKASGIGVFDRELEAAVLAHRRPGTLVLFWDVDAPATLERLQQDPTDPLRALIPQYDMVLTYGGGDAVVSHYRALGARECEPIYNAVDPGTHHPVRREARFAADLTFMGNRLPDREDRVERFFLAPSARMPSQQFLLAGNGWAGKALPANVKYLGHASTRDHNAMNCSARLVLNVNRASMAACGFSPATRVFEAAGAGACVLSDAWAGIEQFLYPGEHVLLAEGPDDVVRYLSEIRPAEAARIGQAARAHLLAHHTYEHRAAQLEALLGLRTPGRTRQSEASKTTTTTPLNKEHVS